MNGARTGLITTRGHRDNLAEFLRTMSGFMAARFDLPEGHLAEAFKVVTLN